MPKVQRDRVPRYCKHKGYAVVYLGGQTIYLGRYGTKASELEYDRVILEWIAAGRPSRWHAREESSLTVSELLAAYWKHVETYYVKNGRPTEELGNIRTALGPVRRLYGAIPAVEFGPLALEAAREQFIADGIVRTSINQHVTRIRRVFKWGVAKQLVPVEVFQALRTVEGLKRGRCDAREATPKKPVSEAAIQATLHHLPQVVADMVRLQRLTGARPGEICILRPCDLDTSAEQYAGVWLYQPAEHKTEHHGLERMVFIGPKGQAILRPYLLRAAESFCFSPAESERQRREEMHAQRKTPLAYGNRPGTNRKRTPRRSAGDRYNVASYRRAIHRACDLAFPPEPPLARREGEMEREWLGRLTTTQLDELADWQSAHRWSPNQLRHSAATEIRKKYGLEGTQVILGHKHAKTTEIYAERDFQLAARVAIEVG